MYSQHELKVYHNSIIVTKEQTFYDYNVRRRDELIELLDLFSHKSVRTDFHSTKRQQIIKTYNPVIKEAKRVLTNSKKRFNYNLERC